jgi:CarD family transcriptional regulator
MAQAKTTAKSKAKTAPKAADKSSAKSAKPAAKAAKPAVKAAAAAKPAAPKTAPKTPTARTAAAKAAPKAALKAAAPQKAEKPAKAEAKPAAKPVAKPAVKKPAKKLAFARGDYVVYPTHGVGKVTGVEKQEIAGFNLQLFVILFESEKMTLRVPVEKVADSGLRKISSKDKMMAVIGTLKGRARSKRTMWSRRAQEYEAKINSGDPVAIAEVVRDLYRAPGQPEQSYSERQMYEAALERLVNEYALVEKLDVDAATQKLENVLSGA